MVRKLFLGSMAALLALSAAVPISFAAETPHIGSVVKLADGGTLYYVASDGKRYVYPNEQIYKSWFTDFADVTTITAEEMAAIPLVGSIRYRPGVVLIKVQTDPRVYAVSKNGKLRWVKTEALARRLYGENWSKLVDDLGASFFSNYTTGDDIDDESDYDADEEVNAAPSVEKNRGLKLGHAKRATTARCRAVKAKRAVAAKRGERAPPATPAISARACKLNRSADEVEEGSDESETTDSTAPVISAITSSTASTTATISWTTNEASTSKVKYATEPLAAADSIESVSDPDLVTSHSLTLTDLTASTTYYFSVWSQDGSGNATTGSEQTFSTPAQ